MRWFFTPGPAAYGLRSPSGKEVSARRRPSDFLRRKRFWAGLFLLHLLVAAGLQPLRGENWEGLPVLAVRQQPDHPQEATLEPAELERIVSQKPGQPYSTQKIRESIERLFATGRFADIRVDAERELGGVVLTFLTQSRYFIGTVAIQGVEAPPSDSQLRAATRLQLGHPFSEDALSQAVEGLRRALEEDGYFQCTIVPALQPHPDTQQIDILFQVRAGERARLGEITVTGKPVFSAERLTRQAKWKAGKSFTSKMVQDGLTRIRKLYRQENYLEVSLRLTRRLFHPQNNGVDLELDAVAGDKIEVSVAGARLDESKKERLLPIFEEGTLDEDLLEEGERNLRDYFESQGYFDAQVRYVRKPSQDGRVLIEYQVELGERQHLKEIRITGNRYFSAETLRERLRIEPASLTLQNGRFSSSLLEQDLGAIRALYQTNGFPQVEATGTLLREGAGTHSKETRVDIRIEEGPQVLIGDFSISGNRTFSQEQLEGVINAAAGQPYSESLVASDRDHLLTFYFNGGFPDARFRWQATPREDGKRMDLEYSLEEGPRQYVRHIFVEGLHYTRRGVVNRQLQLRDDDPLSQGAMIETQRRLYDLGIFNQAEVVLQNPQGAEPKKTVLVSVEEARRSTLKIGLGTDIGRFGGSASDVTEVEGKNEISPNLSLDLTRLNVGGRPHTLSFRSRLSSLQKRAGLTYTAPRLLNFPWLNASATALFDETRDVRTFTARRLEGSIQMENRRSRAHTFFYRYTFRRVTVDTTTLRISPDQIPLLGRPVLVGMLSQTWIRDTRENPADARQGMFSSADLGIASRPLGSEASFFRVLLQDSFYHRLNSKLVLAHSVQFGLQTPFGKARRVEVDSGSTHAIPIAERFFAGGGNSHRGFAVNQAGPRDPQTGFAVGGNALLLSSLELRFPIWRETIGGVLFHDAGNVFGAIRNISLRQHQRKPEDFQGNPGDFSYLSHALGFGLRYKTPVGPVRIDLGYNWNPTRFLITTGTVQNLSRWQVLFSIGQSF